METVRIKAEKCKYIIRA